MVTEHSTLCVIPDCLDQRAVLSDYCQQHQGNGGHSPLPWEAFPEKIIVSEPERVRVVIRAANGYRVVVEDNPSRWEQALKDFELICRAVNSQNPRK